MYGLWQRMTRVWSAEAHALVDRREDPAAMLDQVQRELVHALGHGKARLASAQAWLAALGRELRELDERVEQLTGTARRALAEGEEAIAREAVATRRRNAARRERLESQRAEADTVVARLREQLERRKVELMDLRERRRMLLQRARFVQAGGAAPAHGELAEPLREVVLRMEEKIDLAAAAAGLEEDEPHPDAPLDAFAERAAIDDELADLRRQLKEEGNRE